MPDLFPIFVVVAIVIVIAIAGSYAWKLERYRREALAIFARELGWRFTPGRDYSHSNDFAQFEIFRRGHSRAAMNTLEGEMEIKGRRYRAMMGDYRYKITSGTGTNQRTTTYTFSYLIVNMPFNGVRVPQLLIRREGLFDKLAGAFGFDDINFESAEFSRKYHVSSPDRKFAYDVIDPRMMEFILRTDPPTIDIERSRCCVSDGRSRWSVEKFRAMQSWVIAFFEHWPRHVKATLDA